MRIPYWSDGQRWNVMPDNCKPRPMVYWRKSLRCLRELLTRQEALKGAINLASRVLEIDRCTVAQFNGETHAFELRTFIETRPGTPLTIGAAFPQGHDILSAAMQSPVPAPD